MFPPSVLHRESSPPLRKRSGNVDQHFTVPLESNPSVRQPTRRRLGLFLALALLHPLVTCSAGEAKSAAGPDLRLRGIFETDLPRTEWRSSLRFVFHPHFGDLTRRDYLRVPLGFRYGLTERWELSGDLEGYLAHGLGGAGLASEAGLSGLRIASKCRWSRWLRPGVETATGSVTRLPLVRHLRM